MTAADQFRDGLRRNAAGEGVGVASICSAHPLVLDTAMRRAAAGGGVLLVEATCNQVNQDGGYTGQTPARFRDLAWTLAEAAGLPRERLLLGGDHLGPNPWRARPAAAAMEKASGLVAAFAAAGYRKLHLDASMACADDPPALPPGTIAARAAALCAVAERSAAAAGLPPPLYVIGTEVPTPGGATEALDHLTVTAPGDVAHTLELHRAAFSSDAFARVAAVVAQPGVEFGIDSVHDFAPDAAVALSAALAGTGLVFEAHSTDYQRGPALRALVQARCAILKVGPELTFALREALFALDAIVAEATGACPSPVRAALERAMAAEPRWWSGYAAPGDAVARLFGLSDRVRYYWPAPEVERAVRTLLALPASALPPTLVSQYLPRQYEAWRDGAIALTPRALVAHRIGEVLDRYDSATGAIVAR